MGSSSEEIKSHWTSSCEIRNTNASSVWNLLPPFINDCSSLEELKDKTGLRVFFGNRQGVELDL